ncbi:outer membrane protein [Xanthobacter pseudotagetidis]|uniref:outer membrane protein n=1 Tax=Xanthobacter pseudotagetidis TaxID=3119911 RepID=UPI00372B3AAF
MMRSLLAGVALLAFAACPARAAEPGAVPAFSWTGFHAGASAGYAWGEAGRLAQVEIGDDFIPGYPVRSIFHGVPVGPEGWFGAIQAGYNYQLANGTVLGFEADVAIGQLGESVPYAYDTPDTRLRGEVAASVNAFGTARVRIGQAFGRFLPYVTGGLAWGRVAMSNNGSLLWANDFDSPPTYHAVGYSSAARSTALGWTLGAGAEYALADRWSVKAEYLYLDLGGADFAAMYGDTDDTLFYPSSGRADVHLHTVRMGINYRF